MIKPSAAALLVAAPLILAACGDYEDPCLGLQAPSAEAVAAARAGAEVEMELRDGTECVINPNVGEWQVEEGE